MGKKTKVGASSEKNENGVATVVKGGAVIRKYSEEVHGENYKELAEEFASKEAGRSVK